MPVHDWSRVEPGIFHGFHLAWLGQLQHVLNRGILPKGFYAIAELEAGDEQPDVLTLQRRNGGPIPESPAQAGALMVADAPPKVWLTASYEAGPYLTKQRTLAIRATNDDRVVAVVEIVSWGNKSGTVAFDRFVEKALNCFAHDVSLVIVDLHRPTKRDPQGVHGAIMREFNGIEYQAPPEKKLTLVSYDAGNPLKAYIQPIAPGDVLPDMPLFLDRGIYVEVPLEPTYQTAFDSLPDHLQQQLRAI